jgi:hypothetical protein
VPKIGNGRVSTDGTGTVSFKYDNQVIPVGSTAASTALSVTGNTEGNATPVFLNQNSNVGNVILNFASLRAGTNITFDTTSEDGEILISSTGGGGGGGASEFIQLTDGPEAYSSHSLLTSTSSAIAWTAAPSGANQFLYWTGSTFAWTANVVTSVSAVGASGQITVTGSPINSTGTLTIGLATAGTAGTYNTVTVDAYGRVVSGTTSGGSSTVTLGGDVSGTGQTGTTITTTLASVASAENYTAGAVGIVLTSDGKGRVLTGRALALADLTTIGAAPINSPTFTGVPLAPTPNTVDNSTKIATTAWVVNQGYLVAPLVATGDVSGTSSGSAIALTLATVVTAGTYSTVTVDAKGRVIHGVTSSGGVTSIALSSPASTLSIGGSPITSSGTLTVDMPTVVIAGTYTSVQVDQFGRVIAGATGGTGGTVTNVGATSSTLVVSNSPITVSGTFDIELHTIGTAGTYNTVTVDAYGRVIAGTSGGGGGGISNIGLASTTLTITGSPLTSNGTLTADLPSVVAAGTYTAVGVDVYGRVTSQRALAYADLPSQVQVSLFPFSFPGAPAASIDIVVPIVQATTIPNGFTSTAGLAITPASDGSGAVFTLSYLRAGTQTTIGTITFGVGTNTATISYALGSSLSLVAGDALIMTTPGTVDSTLSNVGITIYALKV